MCQMFLNIGILDLDQIMFINKIYSDNNKKHMKVMTKQRDFKTKDPECMSTIFSLGWIAIQSVSFLAWFSSAVAPL